MLPTDLATRLRLLVESSVQPLAATRELPADLPQFTPGQRFTAKIEAALPDGTFRALVGGRTLTLSLPQAANPGESLNLVVVARTPRHLLAELSESPASAGGASLSRAGQLIGSLLDPSRGAPQAALLRRGAPILSGPPLTGADLLPQLRQALAESGMFYESHQSQWASGRLPAESLLREPQGRHSPAAAPMGTTSATADEAAATKSFGPTAPLSQAFAGHGEAESGALPIPADILPVVQQQLDAAGNHHLSWQGQLWPGQHFEWQIVVPLEDEQGTAAAQEDEARSWQTRLRLTLPSLGKIDASIVLTQSGVAVSIDAEEGESTAKLREAEASLWGALGAAGVPLLGFKVEDVEAA